MIHYSETRDIEEKQVIALYEANEWSSAGVPETLMLALRDSHHLVTAWHDDTLVGLGNAISDGHLVVYYPHLLVLPNYQGQGIGTHLLDLLKERYVGFHMHMLTADGKAIEFYRRNGFERAGQTQPMWIYSGSDH